MIVLIPDLCTLPYFVFSFNLAPYQFGLRKGRGLLIIENPGLLIRFKTGPCFVFLLISFGN